MPSRWLHIVVSMGLSVALLAGCEQKGPAQKAGEKLDEAAKKVKDATK